MTPAIEREFENFSKFLTDIDHSQLTSFKKELYEKIGNIADLIDDQTNHLELRDRFFQLFDKFDLSPIHRRARTKPLGYSGDYLLIDWIYTKKTSPFGINRFFDLLFHSYEAAKAVRNRKRYFTKKCIRLARLKKELNVLNVGCGSCRDVSEILKLLKYRESRVHFHCIDHEPLAIQYAKSILNENGFRGTHNIVELECVNLIKFKAQRKYDLIWSAGFFDYLDKRTAQIVIKKLWRLLKDQGQIIFGNFSPKNPTRKGMELGCQWHLIHRTAGELIDLCQATGVPFSGLKIESEPLGINLFCTLTKGGPTRITYSVESNQ